MHTFTQNVTSMFSATSTKFRKVSGVKVQTTEHGDKESDLPMFKCVSWWCRLLSDVTISVWEFFAEKGNVIPKGTVVSIATRSRTIFC